ncbi:rhodanese-like domain-containing protein [Bacterioplanoides sp.]|uniref:rhodanese-like domain-containing protein n=1 Tax=Bacterioplanoides sp. TaxID=2066072 RepID=UPI003B00D100
MKLITILAAMLLSFSAWASEPVWIDVRSAGEFAGEHLEGAHNIPHTQISVDIAALNINKDAEILLYCRSGRRAGVALQALQELGYTNVKNVGGLEDAQSYSVKE